MKQGMRVMIRPANRRHGMKAITLTDPPFPDVGDTLRLEDGEEWIVWSTQKVNVYNIGELKKAK